MRIYILTLLLTGLCWSEMIAYAGNLDGKPLGFRILLTQDRTTNLVPVAHPIASVNPGADDFLRDPPFSFGVAAATAIELASLNGGGVSVIQGGGFYRPEKVGTFTAIYGRTDVKAKTRQGDDFSLGTNAGSFRYSHRLQPDWGVGGVVKVGHTESALANETLKIRGSATTAEVTAGALTTVNPQWTLGLMATAGGVWSDSVVRLDESRLTDASRIFLTRLRGGAGWRPLPNAGLYLDWQYLHVSDKTESVNLGRTFLTAEYLPVPPLALRLSTIIDTAGRSTYTAGAGYYGIRNWKIDMAYSYDAFTEVRKEFGRSHYLVVIIGAVF